MRNIDDFTKRLRDLISDAEMSDHNIPTDVVVCVLRDEAARLDGSETRFMHEMRKTY